MPRLNVDFYSFTLHSSTSATVILPQSGADFLSGGIRYNEEGKIPVLWLLHGMGDDHTGWIRYTNLERYALARGIAVVCPAVLNQSFYCNMIKGTPYYDYIAYDLPKVMREMFPQFSERREDNYIAGLSMGGYGALKFGLSLPENYGHVGCLSAGNFVFFEKYLPSEEEADSFLSPFYGIARNSFGTPTMEAAAGSDADLYTLLDRALAQGKLLPELHMYCGTEDFVKPISDETADYIRPRVEGKTGFSYKQGPGVHNWDFWDHWLPVFMNDCGLTSLVEAAQFSEVKD